MEGRDEHGRLQNLDRLRRDAEREMRRNLDDERPQKRPKHPDGDGGFPAVDRYRYAVVEELEAGAKGFLITCNFRKEKSATREATQLLRRYLPEHLFPPGPQQPDAGAVAGSQPTAGTPTDPAAAAAANATGGADGRSCGVASGAGADSGGGGDGGRDGGTVAAVDSGSEDSGGSDGDDDGDQPDGGTGEGGGGGDSRADPHGRPHAVLALAKVGCRGVVLMRLSRAAAAEVDPVSVVAAMLADCEAGRLPPATHCQRITPLDSTCAITPAGLSRAVAQAAAAHTRRVQGQQPTSLPLPGAQPGAGTETGTATGAAADPAVADCASPVVRAGAANAAEVGVAGSPAAAEEAAAALEPFTYAVVYHSRLNEPTGTTPPAPPHVPPQPQAPTQPQPSVQAQPPTQPSPDRRSGGGCADEDRAGGGDGGGEATDAVLDRGRIISVVAAGMAAAFGEVARVRLRKPQVAVLVESVPVAGRHLAGVTVLGQQLFVAKGKLLVKPLALTAKTPGGR